MHQSYLKHTHTEQSRLNPSWWHCEQPPSGAVLSQTCTEAPTHPHIATMSPRRVTCLSESVLTCARSDRITAVGTFGRRRHHRVTAYIPGTCAHSMHNIIIFSVFSATTAYGNGIGVSNIIIEVITHSGWDDRQYRLNRGTTIALRVVEN